LIFELDREGDKYSLLGVIYLAAGIAAFWIFIDLFHVCLVRLFLDPILFLHLHR
jgi:hypothetical protein